MFPDSVKEEKNLIEIKYLSGIKKWCFMLIYFFKAGNKHIGHYSTPFRNGEAED